MPIRDPQRDFPAGYRGAADAWDTPAGAILAGEVFAASAAPSVSIDLAGSVGQSHAAGPATLTVTKPAGMAIGDLWLVAITLDSTTANRITTPSGWTALTAQVNSTADQAALYTYRRTIDGSEGASQGFVSSSGSTGVSRSWRVSGASGVNVVASSSGNTAVTPVVPAGTVTTTVDGCALAFIAVGDFTASGTPTWSAPSGWSGLVAQSDGGFNSLAVSKIAQTSAGAISTSGGSVTQGATTGGYAAVLVAFAPVSTSGIVGTAAQTLDPITSAAAGGVRVSGAAAQAIAAVSQAAAGTVRVSGAAAQTISAITPSAAGAVAVAGSAAQNIGPVTQAAAGTVPAAVQVSWLEIEAAAPSSITGTADATLGPVTSTASGTVLVTGAAAQAIAAVVGSGAGAVLVSGAAAQTLPGITQASAGTVRVSGAAAQSLGAVTQAAAGAVVVAGAAAQTIGAVTQVAAGSVVSGIVGTAAQQLGPITQASAGVVVVAGTGAQPIGPVTQVATGTVAAAGIYTPAPRRYISPDRAKVFSPADRARVLASPARTQAFAPLARTVSFTPRSRAITFTPAPRVLAYTSPARNT